MSQGLHLSQKMSLSQVLAPQLQQSLALLQAPTLELKALVEQELQQNPVLEEVSAAEIEQSDKIRDDGAPAHDASDPAEPPADTKFDPATEKPQEGPVDDFQAEFEKLTQMDQEWRDHFSATNLPMRQSQEDRGASPVHVRFARRWNIAPGKPLGANAVLRFGRGPPVDCRNDHRQHRRLRLSQSQHRRTFVLNKHSGGQDFEPS